MRMWMVNPKIMCRKHLLGEHVECHMFVGTLNQGKSVNGYLRKGLLEIKSLHYRHKELVIEMKKRGYKHKSELPLLQGFKLNPNLFNQIGRRSVNRVKSLQDLVGRCLDCKNQYELMV